MGQVIDDGDVSATRRLARMFEPIHSVTYYSQEILALHDEGYRGWWHAYFGYRPAPMGPVPAGVVTATFYNFAPRMVERAVPGVWGIKSPEEATARRLELVTTSMDRIFGPGSDGEEVAAAHFGPAAELGRRAIEGCDVSGRPLYGAYAELPWPDDPAVALWHACTLLREHRGDSHNLALAGADLDGVECHIMMASHGFGNRPTIQGIRGWSDDEWDGAVDRLNSRGWLSGDNDQTDTGREARSWLERRTDELAAEPTRRLGLDRAEELVGYLAPIVDHLKAIDEVAGVWPPPTVIRPAHDG